MIPAHEYFNKLSAYRQLNKDFIEYDRDSVKFVHERTLWCVTVNRPFFQITEMSLEGAPSHWKVHNRYISNAKMYIKS